MNKDIKPFIKWVGGKRQFIKRIDFFLSQIKFNNYFEPFVGGGALYFHMKKSGYINKWSYINDFNSHLIAAYQAVKDEPKKLMTRLDWYQDNNNKEFYNKERKSEKRTILTKGARMIYLNKAGFNGMWRENSQGGFNVPYGNSEGKNMYSKENIESVSNILSNKTTITNFDYKEILKKAKSGDFVFVDPPYDVEKGKKSFTTYTGGGFGIKEQKELSEVLKALDKKGVKWLATNHNTKLIQELYKEFNHTTLHATRFINSDASKRKEGTEEIFIWNFPLILNGKKI